MVSSKVISKKQTFFKSIFAFVLIVMGILFNYIGIGNSNFLGYASLGSYLIFVGFLVLIVSAIIYFRKKDRIIDERMEKIGFKASRLTFVIMVIFAFGIMIADGIKEITMRYSLFMGYAISAYLLVYVISYKIIERKS